MNDERWLPVRGYEQSHWVSNHGRVASKTKLLTLFPTGNRNLYLGVMLCRDGKMKKFRVNRLVALNFIPNPSGLPDVDHINRDKTNNRVDNLQWLSRAENGTGRCPIDSRIKEEVRRLAPVTKKRILAAQFGISIRTVFRIIK